MEFVKTQAASVVTILFLYLLVVCMESHAAPSGLKFHERMNQSLLKKMFDVESYEEVPEYDVIQVRILSNKSADDLKVIRLYLPVFGTVIPLRLERNDFMYDRLKSAKMFTAEITESGFLYKEIILEDDASIPYEDLNQMASITINHDANGILEMEGIIGNDIAIKPVPANFTLSFEDFVHDAYSTDEDMDSGYNVPRNYTNSFGNYSSATDWSGLHLVYKIPMKPIFFGNDYVLLEDYFGHLNDSGTERLLHKNINRPVQAWPEVLLLVDSESYSWHLSHGLNDDQIRRYYVSFLNGVEMRFRILTNPKINLVLTRIIVYKNIDSTPYIKANTFTRYPAILFADKAIKDMSLYMYSAKMKNILPEFDVAILLTKLNVCSSPFLFTCSSTVRGLSNYMGACKLSHSDERFWGVGIVEDSGGFNGILTAAHEIGHLLGAVHDGEQAKFGRDDTSRCSPQDEYLMGPFLDGKTTSRMFQWSECSIEQFRRFLSSENASCLLNRPKYHNELVGSELPGSILSLHRQCERLFGMRACAFDSEVCTNLRCYRPLNGGEISCLPARYPAAEGSYCGRNLHCRGGVCVPKSGIRRPL